MSDNVTANGVSVGGGAVFATDDIGGVQYPRTKISIGADGAATDCSTANPLPVAGPAAHDAVAAGSPILNGGYASAAAPSDVSADGDVARSWVLRNGAACVNVTAAGALIPGDATVGLRTACSGGTVAHDGVGTSNNPVLTGGYASAAAPSDVSADGDATRTWVLRNGATAVNLTAAGALIPGDATVGLRTACSGGTVAHDAADSGNPVKVGGKATNAIPTAVANADRTDLSTDVYGRALVSHIDAGMQVWKSFNATSTQTGVAIWTPTSGKKIVITSMQVGAYGATAARCIIWFGAVTGPDTTYTEGTDQVVLKQSFAPSANGFPGSIQSFPGGLFCANADYALRITTDAGMSVDVVVYGYEI